MRPRNEANRDRDMRGSRLLSENAAKSYAVAVVVEVVVLLAVRPCVATTRLPRYAK